MIADNTNANNSARVIR